MKTLLAALLVTLSNAAAAACYQHPDTGEWYCTDPQLCAGIGAAAWRWNPTTQRCEPPQPVPPVVVPPCEVRISFNADAPAKPVIVPGACDRASVELAVAVALAQLLGAAP